VVISEYLPAESHPDNILGCIQTTTARALLRAGEVRVEPRAAAVNFAESLSMCGAYQIRVPLPFTPGGDWAGVVTEVGPQEDAAGTGGGGGGGGGGVGCDVVGRRIRVGDRVFGGCASAIGNATGEGGGGFSEQLVCRAAHVRLFPPNVSFAQASMLTTTYGTAHYALRYEANLRPGEVRTG
jgi:NADPH2:quinone reductase